MYRSCIGDTKIYNLGVLIEEKIFIIVRFSSVVYSRMQVTIILVKTQYSLYYSIPKNNL